MPTCPIIKRLDVFEDVLFRSRSCDIVSMLYEFPLQSSEKTLNTDVIPAIAGAAHPGCDAMRGEHLLVGLGRILAPTVGVMQESDCGLPCGERHAEGLFG